MLDATFTTLVTIRKPKKGGRDINNEVVYEEFRDEAECPQPVRCRLEKRRRRVVNTEGFELEADASLAYRVDRSPKIDVEDLIVFTKKNGELEVFKVATFENLTGLFVNAEYGRLALTLVRTKVPKDAPRG